jgi:hypothetical protein
LSPDNSDDLPADDARQKNNLLSRQENLELEGRRSLARCWPVRQQRAD